MNYDTMYFPMVFSLILLLSSLTEIVVPMATVELRLLSYVNQKGITEENNLCCDNTNQPTNDYRLCFMSFDTCDYRFYICLSKLALQPKNSQDNCWTTGTVYNAKTQIFFNNYIGRTANPIVLKVSSWPQRLTIHAQDEDFRAFQEVDLFIVNITMAPFANARLAQPVKGTLYGLYSNSSLTLSITVYCEDDFYGYDCAHWCRPADNLRYCDSSGNTQCYVSDKQGNCVQACDLSPCLHGECRDNITHFRCYCKWPWRGVNCSQHPCDELHCGNNGVCLLQGNAPICACNPGFTGARCETQFYTSPCSSHNCHTENNNCGLMRGNGENCGKTTSSSHLEQESAKGPLATEGVPVTESLTSLRASEIQPSWRFPVTNAVVIEHKSSHTSHALETYGPVSSFHEDINTCVKNIPEGLTSHVTSSKSNTLLNHGESSKKQTNIDPATSPLSTFFSSSFTPFTFRPSVPNSPSPVLTKEKPNAISIVYESGSDMTTTYQSIQPGSESVFNEYTLPTVVSSNEEAISASGLSVQSSRDILQFDYSGSSIEIATNMSTQTQQTLSVDELQYSPPSTHNTTTAQILTPTLKVTESSFSAKASHFNIPVLATEVKGSDQMVTEIAVTTQQKHSTAPSHSALLIQPTVSMQPVTQVAKSMQTVLSDLSSHYSLSLTETAEPLQTPTLIIPSVQTVSPKLSSQYTLSPTHTVESVPPLTHNVPSLQTASSDLPKQHSPSSTEIAQRVQQSTQFLLHTHHTKETFSSQSPGYYTPSTRKPPLSSQLHMIESLPSTRKTYYVQNSRRIIESFQQSEPTPMSKGVSAWTSSMQNPSFVKTTAHAQSSVINPTSENESVPPKRSDKFQSPSLIQQTPHISMIKHQSASEMPAIRHPVSIKDAPIAQSPVAEPTTIQPAVGMQRLSLQSTPEFLTSTPSYEPFAPQVDNTVITHSSTSARSSQDFSTSSAEIQLQSKSARTHGLTSMSTPERATISPSFSSFSSSQTTTEKSLNHIVNIKFGFAVTPEDLQLVTNAIASYLVGKVPLCQSLSRTVVAAVDHQRLPADVLSLTINCNGMPIDQSHINQVIADDNDDFINAISKVADRRRNDGQGSGHFAFVLAGAGGGSVVVIIVVIAIFCIRHKRNSSKAEEEKSVMFRNPIYGNSNV